MASLTAFAMLCTDLGHVPSGVSPELRQLLELKLDAAAAELQEDAGITIDESRRKDLELLVLYARWLYTGRVNQAPMPWMLQRRIHNRQVAQATGGGA